MAKTMSVKSAGRRLELSWQAGLLLSVFAVEEERGGQGIDVQAYGEAIDARFVFY